ncbi:MAG: hypothetical protein ACM3SQ_11110 [Betaproteobacteria bacterium]
MIAPARAVAVAGLAAALASCAAPRVQVPGGAGTPASDGAAVAEAATGGCRTLRSLTAEIRVSGTVLGRRIRGRLSAGFAAPASARIEAVAPFGPPIFILVATDASASLLLPRDNRVVRGAPADLLLDALVGMRLTPAELWQAVTACPAIGTIGEARQYGSDWRRVTVPPHETLYFHRDEGAWHLVADMHQEPETARQVEYLQYDGALPVRIHLSAGGANRAAAYEIALDLSQLEPNAALDPAVFTLEVSAGAQPMTLDELRRSGPLAVPGGAHD